jgi:hypothetical protein
MYKRFMLLWTSLHELNRNIKYHYLKFIKAFIGFVIFLSPKLIGTYLRNTHHELNQWEPAAMGGYITCSFEK